MGGRDTDIVLLDENGIRSDGRKINETRKVSITAGVLKNANGSAYVEFGENKILVGVYGPRDVHPKHLSNTDTGILRCRYHMTCLLYTSPSPRDRSLTRMPSSA